MKVEVCDMSHEVHIVEVNDNDLEAVLKVLRKPHPLGTPGPARFTTIGDLTIKTDRISWLRPVEEKPVVSSTSGMPTEAPPPPHLINENQKYVWTPERGWFIVDEYGIPEPDNLQPTPRPAEKGE